jgi:hypothetical protein
MSDFVEVGWLHELNRQVVNPLGWHIAFYIDDADGSTAIGWVIVPLDAADIIQPSPAERAQRLAALANHLTHLTLNKEAPPPCEL